MIIPKPIPKAVGALTAQTSATSCPPDATTPGPLRSILTYMGGHKTGASGPALPQAGQRTGMRVYSARAAGSAPLPVIRLPDGMSLGDGRIVLRDHGGVRGLGCHL